MAKTLGKVLQKILDSPHLGEVISRKQWVNILPGIDKPSAADIERWVSDEAMPTPDQLACIVDLEQFSNTPALDEWESIVDCRIFEVVPRWHEFEQPIQEPHITTLGMYALWPRYQGVLRMLGCLTQKEQVKLLDWVRDEFLPKHENFNDPPPLPS